MNIKKWLDVVAMALSAAGGITWGLIGFSNYNPIESLLPFITAKYVYIAVGIATVWLLFKRRD